MILDKKERPFNLYVYQAGEELDSVLGEEELILRYNVNGIELNEGGFEKLTREIDLKTMHCLIPEIQREPIIIHTGKFPLVTGSFQRLILREDWLQALNPADLQAAGKVNRRFFEVCTLNALKQYVEDQEKIGSF